MISAVPIDIAAHLDDWGLWVAGVTTGLAGIGWLVRRGWRSARHAIRWGVELSRTVEALNEIAQYELRPNHGGSLKDHAAQVPGLVGQIETLSDQFAERGQILSDHMESVAEEQARIWAAIRALEA